MILRRICSRSPQTTSQQLFFTALFIALHFYTDAKFSSSISDSDDDHVLSSKSIQNDVSQIVTDVDTKCPEDWHHLDGKCYRLYPMERSWPQALTFCSRFGAVLARIESQKENTFVSKLLAKPLRSASASTKYDFWIGLLSQQNSGDGEGSSFVWSNGVFVSRYVGFWDKGQPDYLSGSCTKASLQRNNNLVWRLEMCNFLLPFICEIPSCVKGQFFCHSGGCVPEKSHCNGVDDCGDLSDELNCPASRSELACLRHEKGESGRFESPNFPSSYSAGANCRWVIEGPINSRIQLTFDSFETEENQDFVTVLDGGPAENSTTVLAQLSGMPKSDKLMFTSSSNQMIVRFRSDALIHARGFQATWKAVQYSCGGALKAQGYAQTFSSPEFPRPYPNGLECVWTIDAPAGSLISLNIENFELEENRDFMVIYDGAQPSASVLTRLSGRAGNYANSVDGGFGSYPPIISSQNKLYIYFFTDHAQSEHRGFSITYKKGCDNVIHNSYGTIVSPGYLNVPYPSSKHCKYTIELPDSNNEQSITLVVNSFDLAVDDSLQIFEGGANGRALHEGDGFSESHQPSKTIYAKQGKVEVDFITNSMRTSLGFNITYSTNCPSLVVPSLVATSTKNTAFGTKVTVSCGRGFEFVTGRGRFFDIHCELGGHWTESTLPDCQPIFCSPVPQISNGFAISATNVSFGGMARYGCNDGFSFSSGKKIEEVFCTDEGRWTSTPQCRAETCAALLPFSHGKRKLLFGDGIGYGSVYDYQCAPGYRREGAATILCQADGQWSSSQPICKKLSCTEIPKVENGRVLIQQNEPLYFGDSAQVECNSGFRSVGAEAIKCLANQTLSGVPKCEDINECEEQTSNCAPKTTTCINSDGGYHCQCQPGFKSQMACTNAVSIQPIFVKSSSGIYSTGLSISPTTPPKAISVGLSTVQPISGSFGRSWCAESGDPTPSLTFTFSSVKIIEKLRVEKVGVKGFPTRLRLYYANDTGIPLTLYKNVAELRPLANASFAILGALQNNRKNESEDILSVENIASTGSDVLVLSRVIEARVVRLEIVEFENRACSKFDLMGCQKTSCVDINECEENNGFCEHNCHNLQGSHRCSCKEGYDLFVVDGQGGLFLKEGENGNDDFDVLRFNKSCVSRHCASLSAPQNGKIVSTQDNNGRFAFPQVVEFVCDFGHQIRGSNHLMCLADGTWNGTAPVCIPAACVGVKNNSAVGLFVQPESASIPYGQNVSILCSQQNRPGKFSLLSSSRQCIYDPRPGGPEYWLSGPEIDCPLVDCGVPPVLAGAYYEDAVEGSNKVGGAHLFHCRPPYVLVGKSSYDDRMIRCNVDGTWDLGDLRCEGPVCPDPGNPADGETHLTSVEESAIARFSCKRPGYRPFPNDAINCTLGTSCVLSEDVGISTGYIPDGAFGDNSDTTIWGYEPHKSRMPSTGWCGSKDAFIFLSVDLQRIYTLTTLRLAGVAGSGHLKGHVTKMQLFHKVQFSQNYDNYAHEFTTPSGNHNKMYEFTLNPPVRARYILLGITEYESNPCLRFDLQGCLAPLSPSHEVPLHLQVGWNASIPQCLDAEPPVFTNCPQNPIYASADEHGQLLPIAYAIPEASDNSGIVAHVQIVPDDFELPFPIQQNMDVAYTAFDEAGNSADCVVRLRIPDTQPPVMKCPESYSLWAEEKETQRRVFFNESSIQQQLVVQDMSNITEIYFEPAEAVIKLNTHITVEVTASDAHLNRNRCKFQVALMPEPCSASSLPIDEASTTKTCSKHATGTICTVDCRPGFRFLQSSPTSSPASNILFGQKQQQQQSQTPQQQKFSCSSGNRWSPSNSPLACVPASQEPARYELKMTVNYMSAVPVPPECLEGYQFLTSGFFDTIDTVLTQRCSSSIQVFVRFLDVKFSALSVPSTAEKHLVSANYTVQILPTVLQKVFYQLCGLTLQTIFDLRVPGATTPIRNLLTISGDSVTHVGVSGGASGCPSLNASSAFTWQGYECSSGEILRYPNGVEESAGFSNDNNLLPECLPCPKGTVFVNNTCMECPKGSYQDEEGKSICKPCPETTFTLVLGAQSVNACLPICGDGMYSSTGTIPCQLCPRHTFAGSPIPGGYKECESCPEGTYTARLGSISTNECKLPCQEGHFSASGLEPCSPCPVNFYQPAVGQQRCLQCPNNTMSRETGRSSPSQCQALDCSNIKCQNKGTCTIRNHKEICECRPGFTGRFCEETVPICDSKPCLNGGVCEPVAGTFRCTCPQNFTGSRCQFGPDECVGVNCPNGGVCQDLPGVGTKKCVCRTGFTGVDCSEISDPCHSQNPCRNGADCIPLQLGRLKCKCLPGWDGPNCDRNIDDCAENPCALGAKCHDLLNDFECECPRGFVGKRCNVKEDLCEPDPCQNGAACVDSYFDRKCVCRPGWTGTFCEQNIDECASAPCRNGATCRDQENGYLCECAPGFHGSQCQHMIDHCAVSPCRNNATCVNRGANYACECRLGFEGVHCEHNMDECALLAKCDAQGTETCEDLVNDFLCHCRPGFSGELCKTRIDECVLEPCQNNGTCISTGSGFECECKTGWRGDRCQELETQHCDQKPCQNDGKCVSLVGDFFCVCPEGVNGKRCEITPNRCLGEPCHNGGVCGDFGSRLECTCPKGFVGTGCQYREDACRTNSCKNGATCIDVESSGVTSGQSTHKASNSPGHKCICAPGFTGPNCESEVDECQPSPCSMAATCVDQLNAFHCRCPFNSTGANCEKPVDPDYDLHFYGGGGSLQSAHAYQAAPFKLSVGALTLSVWVRFEKRHTKGTVLTVYHSEVATYVQNLTEILHINAESVRFSLFDDLKPLLLRLPANQRLDDGRWNNLIVTWQARNGGEYSLVWNAVRIFSEKGYGSQRTLNINAFVNLGDDLTDNTLPHATGYKQKSPNTERFVGSITRVNLWTRVLDFEQEIPNIVQRCQGSPVLFNGLALRFAGYDFLSGKVEKVSKSTCGRMNFDVNGGVEMSGSSLLHNSMNTLLGAARHSPDVRVVSCPKDIFIVTPLKEVNITWAEPVFTSSIPKTSPLERVEHNLKSGQMFTWGEFSALYVAYTNDSASAECAFKIHVTREFCPDLEDPVNGVQSCENWGPGLRYRACSIHCDSGYAFSRPPAVFYACGDDGVWRPRDMPNQRNFRYPSCTKTNAADRIAKIHLNYPTLKLCNFAGRNTLTEKIMEKIHQMNSKWNICGGSGSPSGNSTCDGVKIVVDCMDTNLMSTNSVNDATKFHRRRSADSGRAQQSPAQLFAVRIEIPVRKDLMVDTKQLSNGTISSRKMDVTEVIENEALFGELFNLEHILPNGKPELSSFRIQSGFICKAGEVNVGDSCVPCAPGSYFNAELGICELCLLGFYQSKSGQNMCEACPEQKSVTAGPGAIVLSECKESCSSGHYFNVERNTCEVCGHGFYQPNEGSFECHACGIGKTTLEPTAHAEEECRDECPDGEQLTKSGSCQPCALGTYRSRGVDKRCVECPAGTTTETTSSVRKAQCNTPKCAPGQFLIAISKECQLCPRGAYQEEPLQATCKLCPTDFTTAAEGATHESQCYSTNQCAMGEDNCSWKATCIDLPDENDVPSFRCECNPGFRGNGTFCIDACLNHCLNDGVCRKSKVTSREECICKENFSGDRCEIRFQPRSQKLTLWVAVIGGCVLLLIVIVVVIGMISVRFNGAERRQMEKTTMGIDSPMVSNFLYGRPALDRTNSSLGFGSNFNRPSVGFYYEDDSPYEQNLLNSTGNAKDSKSMFIGADSNASIGAIMPPSSHNHGRNPSTDEATLTDISETGIHASATPIIAVGGGNFPLNTHTYTTGSRLNDLNGGQDIEQRVRHAQQHMYRRRASRDSDL